MYSFIQTRQEGAVLWIEITNPPVNFLTTDMLAEMLEVFKKTANDSSVRVVVLTGGLEDTYIMHFSIPELARISGDNQKIGMDKAVTTRIGRAALAGAMAANMGLMDLFPPVESLALFLCKKARERASTMYMWLVMQRLYLAIERSNKITIAAVNGPCNGGGTELSMCFDFRFMVKDQGFTMGQPEVLVGIIPGGGGSQRLPRILGRARAMEWMLAGNQLAPDQAKAWGLITDVFDKKDFRKNVDRFAGKMAKRPPVAVEAVKKAVGRQFQARLIRDLCQEMIQSVRCFASQDTQRALADYISLIKERVEVPPDKRVEPQELFDIMENARYTGPFTGK